MAHPLLLKAAQSIAAARAVREQFGDDVPADAARQIDRHLKDAQTYRAQAERDDQLDALHSWSSEPQYKHDMSLGGPSVGGFDDGYLENTQGAVRPRSSRGTKSFLTYVRSGLGALSMEQKADLVENATGQNLVPTDYAGTIIKQLPRDAVIRGLAYVRPTTKNVVDIGNVVINTAGWGKLETGTTVTDGLGTPAGKDTITVWDLNALVKIGRDELEDSDDNLEQIIRDALTLKFAELEDDAFAGGTGTAMPWGIAARVTSGAITQNVTAATNATVQADDLRKLQYAVPAQFRKPGRACYLAHSTVMQAVSLLKDTTNAYILQPSTTPGAPSTIFGYPAYTVDGLPSMTTTGTAVDPSMVFGDVNAAYMVADRRQITVQRLVERYAETGEVGLLFTERVGGDVIRPNALAAYKL